MQNNNALHQHEKAQVPEQIHDITPDLGQVALEHNTVRHNATRIVGVLAATVALSMAAGDRQPLAAQPAIAAERSSKPQTAKLPSLAKLNQPSVTDAQQLLKDAGFKKRAQVVPTKEGKAYPDEPEGKDYVVTGWAKKVVKKVKQGSKHVTKVSYKNLKSHSKQPTNSRMYMRVKLVSEPAPNSAQENSPEITANNTQPVPVLTESEPYYPPQGELPIAIPYVPSEEPDPTPVPTPEIPEPTPTPEAEPFDFSREVEKMQAEDTLYAPFLGGCSATAIRNSDGKEIGASSAGHCLRTASRITGSDGKKYIVTYITPKLMQGSNTSELQDFSEVSQILLPKSNDANHDLIIMNSKDSTIEQALAAYQKSVVSDADLAKIAKSKNVAYVAGYARFHNDYRVDVPKRTNKAVEIIGRGDVTTGNAQTLTDTVITGISFKPGEARCSFGESGAEGRIFSEVIDPKTGKTTLSFKNLGTLAAFDDFTWNEGAYQGESVKFDRASRYGLNLENYQGLCYFDKKIPTLENSEVVNLVADYRDVPGLAESIEGEGSNK